MTDETDDLIKNWVLPSHLTEDQKKDQMIRVLAEENQVMGAIFINFEQRLTKSEREISMLKNEIVRMQGGGF